MMFVFNLLNIPFVLYERGNITIKCLLLNTRKRHSLPPPPISVQFCLEKGVAHHLIELEFASPKDDLCQVLLKLVQRFCTDRKMEGLLTIGGQVS